MRSHTYRIIFLPGKLTRSLEVDAEICAVCFIILAHVLDSVDVERYSKSMHRQHNCLSLAVHGDLGVVSEFVEVPTRKLIYSLGDFRLHAEVHFHPYNSGSASRFYPPFHHHRCLPRSTLPTQQPEDLHAIVADAP